MAAAFAVAVTTFIGVSLTASAAPVDALAFALFADTPSRRSEPCARANVGYFCYFDINLAD